MAKRRRVTTIKVELVGSTNPKWAKALNEASKLNAPRPTKVRKFTIF